MSVFSNINKIAKSFYNNVLNIGGESFKIGKTLKSEDNILEINPNITLSFWDNSVSYNKNDRVFISVVNSDNDEIYKIYKAKNDVKSDVSPETDTQNWEESKVQISNLPEGMKKEVFENTNQRHTHKNKYYLEQIENDYCYIQYKKCTSEDEVARFNDGMYYVILETTSKPSTSVGGLVVGGSAVTTYSYFWIFAKGGTSGLVGSSTHTQTRLFGGEFYKRDVTIKGRTVEYTAWELLGNDTYATKNELENYITKENSGAKGFSIKSIESGNDGRIVMHLNVNPSDYDIEDCHFALRTSNYYYDSEKTLKICSEIYDDAIYFEDTGGTTFNLDDDLTRPTNYVTIIEHPELGDMFIGENAFSVGEDNVAYDIDSISFGRQNKAIGQYSFTANRQNEAGYCATSFGRKNKATGTQSLTGGAENVASGDMVIALGYRLKAIGTASFATNNENKANALDSAVFGRYNVANGNESFVAGTRNIANGDNSAVFGLGCISSYYDQFVQGKYNKEDPDKIHIVGYGTSDTDRKNIYTLDKSGNAVFGGNITGNNGKFKKMEVDSLIEKGDSNRIKFVTVVDSEILNCISDDYTAGDIIVINSKYKTYDSPIKMRLKLPALSKYYNNSIQFTFWDNATEDAHKNKIELNISNNVQLYNDKKYVLSIYDDDNTMSLYISNLKLSNKLGGENWSIVDTEVCDYISFEYNTPTSHSTNYTYIKDSSKNNFDSENGTFWTDGLDYIKKNFTYSLKNTNMYWETSVLPGDMFIYDGYNFHKIGK